MKTTNYFVILCVVSVWTLAHARPKPEEDVDDAANLISGASAEELEVPVDQESSQDQVTSQIGVEITDTDIDDQDQDTDPGSDKDDNQGLSDNELGTETDAIDATTTRLDESEEDMVSTTEYDGETINGEDGTESTHSWIQKVLSSMINNVKNISQIIAEKIGNVFSFLRGLPAMLWPSYF